MKSKMKKIWDSIRYYSSLDTLKKVFRKQQKNHQLSIPVAGVCQKEIEIIPNEGIILIESTQSIVIEESRRFSPAKTHSSFGFSRSIFLPDGVRVEEIETRIHPDEVKIIW